jgi:hypothetical protein
MRRRNRLQLPLELHDVLRVAPLLFRLVRVQLLIDGLGQLRHYARLGCAHLVKLRGIRLGDDLLTSVNVLLHADGELVLKRLSEDLDGSESIDEVHDMMDDLIEGLEGCE